jgi:hypothetical protein
VKVKWRGTWVVKTVIKSQIYHPVKMYALLFLLPFLILCFIHISLSIELKETIELL